LNRRPQCIFPVLAITGGLARPDLIQRHPALLGLVALCFSGCPNSSAFESEQNGTAPRLAVAQGNFITVPSRHRSVTESSVTLPPQFRRASCHPQQSCSTHAAWQFSPILSQMSGTNGPNAHQALPHRIRVTHVSGRQLRSGPYGRQRSPFDEVDIFRAASAGLENPDMLRALDAPRESRKAAGTLRRKATTRVEAVKPGRGALAMSAIPLHLQRKFEPRWATRFVPPVASAAPKAPT
jgi:hypothetical protein